MPETIKERPVSLHDWQKMFRVIYLAKDTRDYLPSDLFLHIHEEASKIDEGIRKENINDIVSVLPHLFCWLLSYCNFMGVDAEEAAWEKYPAICPYCGRKRNCNCIALEKKPEKLHKNPGAVMPPSLKEWQEMVLRIYGRINKLSWPVQIFCHVHEELGEFSREVRLRGISAKESRQELADCLLWILSYCCRIEVDLAEITWKVYPGMCHICKEKKCQCVKV